MPAVQSDRVPPDHALLDHHGDVEVADGLADFAVNVAEPEPPSWLVEVLRSAVSDLAHYPDPGPARSALATLHGVPAECVLVVAGAAEAFTLVARLPWRRPLVVHPQFTAPEAALRASGHPVERLLLSAEDGFRLGERVVGVPPDVDLVVVGNPTNPTSRLHRPDEVLALVRPGRTVLVDEAFMDVVEAPGAPRHSLTRRAASSPGLVVVRSLTKTFAIAGLRVGYVVADPPLIARLARLQPPWSVGSLATVAAVACAGPEGRAHASSVRDGLPGRLARLVRGLGDVGLEVVTPPRGPFVLARHDHADETRMLMRHRGFAVRRGDTFPGLGPEWLRVAARPPEMTDRLIDALRATLGAPTQEPR
ncbi:Rv2231c family pyridoxal phosphate-dependent protein CobC [Lapillicoccus sp.]|uniref:Rv2231c family pyridoxal phosphate-dependent protein CobC n=1 Tax=Lapillicoccus sp. TaxID=1909287 RepID=UPI003982E673